MDQSSQQWAVSHLRQLLPLDDDSLRQVILYADSLSKEGAAEHLRGMLGTDGKSLEFITDFNLRRPHAASTSVVVAGGAPSASSSTAAVPRNPRPQKKKKADIRSLPARQIDGQGDLRGGYRKRNEEEYIPRASRTAHEDKIAENLSLRSQTNPSQLPLITGQPAAASGPIATKPPPSTAGRLISDALPSSSNKNFDKNSPRASSSTPKAKVNITGGTAMHGASTALSDLDSAIRSLELQTNPTLSATSTEDDEKRKCNCMAARHPLLDIAPNCTACGKIICIKEGLGPCTFCHTQLLSTDEIQKVLRVLKDERGEERMKANNSVHKKADVAQGKGRSFTGRNFLAQVSSAKSSPLSSNIATPATSDDEASDKAKAHRDKLLNFQANNARRTQIYDEAADFDVPSAGTNMWASPHERAQQLKRQQKALREIEWNAKPEYEKRRVVASIDLKGGKVVRRMAEIERPDFMSPIVEDETPYCRGHEDQSQSKKQDGGAFSHNPLAAGLIRPTAREANGKDSIRERPNTWRRVQMDGDDNEQWILDGGVFGGRHPDVALGSEEPACG